MKDAFQWLFVVWILSGCASSIVAVAPDTYMISDSGAVSLASRSELKSEIEKAASEFCAEQRRRMVPLVSGQRAGDRYNFDHAEIRFKCVD